MQPKYCKVRKLPFALKPVVGAKLDRLEKEQVPSFRLGIKLGIVVTSNSMLNPALWQPKRYTRPGFDFNFTAILSIH